MADTASFSAFMKTDLIGPIRDGLHRGMVLLFGGDNGNPTEFQGITRSAEHVNSEGNGFRIPWKTKRTAAVGFRLENDRLPSPGRSEGTYLEEPLRAGYGVFNITGQLLKASESSSAAFESAFKLEMDDTVTSSKTDWNRAAYGDGSGVMAAITGANTGATVPVASTINFRIGEIVDIVTTATGVIGTGNAALTVISVNRSGLTVTLDAAPGTATTSAMGLVRASSSSTATVPNNSWNKETQGLASIVAATGTLHTVSPVTYPRWASTVTSVGGALSDQTIHTAMDTVGFETGVGGTAAGDASYVMITTRGIRSRFAQTLVNLKQFVNADSLHLRGGFKVLDFDGLPIYTDDHCPIGSFYGLSVKDLFWAEASDWEWMEKDGAVLSRVSGYDRYEAVLFKYANLGTTQRNRHFRLTTVTDDTK